jgi:hypothetical protein
MSQCQFPGFACARRVIVNQEDEEHGGETERERLKHQQPQTEVIFPFKIQINEPGAFKPRRLMLLGKQETYFVPISKKHNLFATKSAIPFQNNTKMTNFAFKQQ